MTVVSRVGLLFRTIRRLRLKQLLHQIPNRVRLPRGATGAEPSTISFEWWCQPKGPHLIGNEFFLGKESYQIPDGNPWLPPLPAPFPFALNYLDFIRDPLMPVEQKIGWVEKWWRDHPFEASTVWHPFATSCRLVNMVRVLSLAPSHPDLPNWIATHANVVMENLEYRLYANHLFINAKALSIAGRAIAHVKSDQWRSIGDSILDRELDEQFLSDGGHFERSVMYHRLLIVDLFDLVEALKNDPPPWYAKLKDVAERALEFAESASYRGDRIPLFNDASIEMGPSLEEIRSGAELLGIRPASAIKNVLPNFGLAFLRDDTWELGLDFGLLGPEYQPGHGHADHLAIELFYKDIPLFVDPGTGHYEVSPERSKERSTPSHNSPHVPGKNTSEVWSSFRVGSEAIGRLISHENDRLEAEYVLRNGIKFARSIQMSEGRVEWTDSGNSDRMAVNLLVSEKWSVVQKSNESFELRADTGEKLTLIVQGNDSATLESREYHEQFLAPKTGTMISLNGTKQLRFTVQHS